MASQVILFNEYNVFQSFGIYLYDLVKQSLLRQTKVSGSNPS